MASKKSREQQKRVSKIKSDQIAVDAAYKAITGKPPIEARLKMQEKIDAVLAHYGASKRGLSGCQSMVLAAGMARAHGIDGTPKALPNRAIAPSLGADFYDSWEWKAARFVALKRHGRRCQCCGWSPASGGINHLVVDHIKPLRIFPQLALDPENHQVLCNDCNKGKSFKHTDDFRQ